MSEAATINESEIRRLQNLEGAILHVDEHVCSALDMCTDILQILTTSATTLDGIANLQEYLAHAVRDPNIFPQAIVPVPWLQLVRKLEQLRTTVSCVLNTDDFKRWKDVCAFTSDEDFECATEFLHDAGYLLSFESLLPHQVIIRPQWLLTAISVILRHDLYDSLVGGKRKLLPSLSARKYRRRLADLEGSAVLNFDLLPACLSLAIDERSLTPAAKEQQAKDLQVLRLDNVPLHHIV